MRSDSQDIPATSLGGGGGGLNSAALSSQGRSCVLAQEVLEVKAGFQIPLIECSLAEAKKIQLEGKLGSEVNYLFVHPPSVDEMTRRLLRSRPGEDTQLSLLHKQNKMIAEVKDSKELKWITKSLENSGTTDEFIKKAAIFIVFQMYKLK